MSETTTIRLTQPSRRWIARGLLLAGYAGLMAGSFVLSKSHTLLLDNQASPDGTIKALEAVNISVDGGEPMDFLAGDRDMVKVVSQWHTITISANGQAVRRKIRLPMSEDILLLSIPKLLAGTGPVLMPFTAAPQAPSSDGGEAKGPESAEPTATNP